MSHNKYLVKISGLISSGIKALSTGVAKGIKPAMSINRSTPSLLPKTAPSLGKVPTSFKAPPPPTSSATILGGPQPTDLPGLPPAPPTAQKSVNAFNNPALHGNVLKATPNGK